MIFGDTTIDPQYNGGQDAKAGKSEDESMSDRKIPNFSDYMNAERRSVWCVNSEKASLAIQRDMPRAEAERLAQLMNETAPKGVTFYTA